MGGKGMSIELFWQLPDMVSMTEMNLKFLCKLACQYILGGRGLKFRIIFPFTLRVCDSQLASMAYPWGDSCPGEDVACLLPRDEACCAASTRTRHRASPGNMECPLS